MFWAFKLSFDVNIKAFGQLFQKFGQNFIHCSGHTDCARFTIGQACTRPVEGLQLLDADCGFKNKQN
jgi:hypothetical protein